MIVKQVWTGNAYRNFNYLVACPETGEALAIDPLDHEKTLNTAKARGNAEDAAQLLGRALAVARAAGDQAAVAEVQSLLAEAR